MTVLLLGDSTLARLYHELPDLVRPAFGSDVECQAVGGAWSGSLRHQVDGRNIAALSPEGSASAGQRARR